ncbi:MAG: macro domain-containing protein [Actinomycetota bacterium]|nr:macro domain-containing protein [Actinomycetota bacterium]
MEFKIGKSKFVIIQGDITKQATDAIVNAANKYLSPGGGVSGAIHKASGCGLADECKRLKGCKTGEAKITEGYNLPAKHVIHTVGPVYGGKADDKIDLKNSYRNCLLTAAENKLKSISFPSISTGIFGYPVKEAAEIAVKTIADFLKENSQIELVQMILFGNSDFEIYKKTALKYLKKSDKICMNNRAISSDG